MRKLVFTSIAIVIVLIVTLVYFVVSMVLPVSNATTTIDVTIPSGSGVNEISALLHDVGVLRSQFVFETYVWALRSEDQLQAGTYTFARDLNMIELTTLLTTGRAVDTDVDVLIVEGMTRTEIARTIGEQLTDARKMPVQAIENEFLDASDDAGRFAAAFPFLEGLPESATLEGFLFPDTYRVYKTSTAIDLINKMLTNCDRRVSQELRDAYSERGVSLFEGVTIGSLLEAEVIGTDNRRKVADLIDRRIAAGMPLQFDATVTYLTGKTSAEITNADLEVDSPYNTYQVQGLPPGPIGNPGLDALQAAADPLPNDAYYYLTTADGETIFSRTFEEHIVNKQQYLQ